MGKRSTLMIGNGSSLILMEGSNIEIGRRANIIIEPRARIRVMKGATITGKGKIIQKEGAFTDLSAGSAIHVKLTH